MLWVIKLLVRFYQILDENSQYLNPLGREQLPEVGHILAEQYSKLAKWNHDWGFEFWQTTPKLHMWEHMMEMMVVFMGHGCSGLTVMEIWWGR